MRTWSSSMAFHMALISLILSIASLIWIGLIQFGVLKITNTLRAERNDADTISSLPDAVFMDDVARQMPSVSPGYEAPMPAGMGILPYTFASQLPGGDINCTDRLGCHGFRGSAGGGVMWSTNYSANDSIPAVIEACRSSCDKVAECKGIEVRIVNLANQARRCTLLPSTGVDFTRPYTLPAGEMANITNGIVQYAIELKKGKTCADLGGPNYISGFGPSNKGLCIGGQQYRCVNGTAQPGRPDQRCTEKENLPYDPFWASKT